MGIDLINVEKNSNGNKKKSSRTWSLESMDATIRFIDSFTTLSSTDIIQNDWRPWLKEKTMTKQTHFDL